MTPVALSCARRSSMPGPRSRCPSALQAGRGQAQRLYHGGYHHGTATRYALISTVESRPGAGALDGQRAPAAHTRLVLALPGARVAGSRRALRPARPHGDGFAAVDAAYLRAFAGRDCGRPPFGCTKAAHSRAVFRSPPAQAARAPGLSSPSLVRRRWHAPATPRCRQATRAPRRRSGVRLQS